MTNFHDTTPRANAHDDLNLAVVYDALAGARSALRLSVYHDTVDDDDIHALQRAAITLIDAVVGDVADAAADQ